MDVNTGRLSELKYELVCCFELLADREFVDCKSCNLLYQLQCKKFIGEIGQMLSKYITSHQSAY
jgi:hypothetical protein